jgi:hypothetical protein
MLRPICGSFGGKDTLYARLTLLRPFVRPCLCVLHVPDSTQDVSNIY